jgi:hypothetical protein
MSGRRVLALVGVATALLVVPSAVADPPTLSLPSSFTHSVDGPGPYSVTYSASASDTENGPVTVSCDPASGSDFSYGDTTVNCSATDPSDLTEATGSFTVTVKDDTPPSLSLPAPIHVEVVGLATAPVTYTATANDAGTVGPANCSPASGSTFPNGTTQVNCTATDSRGNTGTGSFNVNVSDTIAPTITVPAPISKNVDGSQSRVVTYTASLSEAGTVSCSPVSGSTFAYGPTTVTCNGNDVAGNAATPASFTVTIVDNTPPTITVPANITQSIPSGTSVAVTYTATATDGSGATQVSVTPTCAPASGSQFPLGTTTVTCNAADAAGNAAAPKSFTVTVKDTTPPVLSITSGPSGTVKARDAAFAFTTSEGTTTCQLDGGAFTACTSPATYTELPDGNHTFTVKATDPAGNSATATRSWKIDATPPVLTLPGTITAEANGPGGAVVEYDVTAGDAGGALPPNAVSCVPASKSLFPLGTTTVSCSATDAVGNVARAGFEIIVRDTTPPTINAPNVSFTASSADGIRKVDPAVASYLSKVSATDLVSTPTLTNDMPAVMPIGKTTVTFTAVDAAKNVSKKQVVVTVLPIGQTAPPPDLTPPGDVTGATAKPGDRSVVLSWKPLASDVAYVTVDESTARALAVHAAGGTKQVYKGTGTRVTVKGLANGTSYRFVIVAWDAAGNSSKGVVLLATPKAEALTSPVQGQKVTKPPLLRWKAVPGATYFNVQVWRGSVKVLSAWPAASRYQLTPTWTYAGKVQKLTPGTYVWYVWPGLGARADAHYGKLLGSRTFVVAQAKPKKR